MLSAKMPAKKVLKIQAIQACLLSFKKVQLFPLTYLKSSRFIFLEKWLERWWVLREINTQNPNKYWLIQKSVLSYFGLSNDLWE